MLKKQKKNPRQNLDAVETRNFICFIEFSLISFAFKKKKNNNFLSTCDAGKLQNLPPK